MKRHIEKALPVKDERALRYSWYHLVSINFSEKLTLIKRNNGRSRGNFNVQTPRRPSAYLLRGKLAAYMVFPLSRSTRLLLLLIVPSTVLFVGYSLAGKQQHVKCIWKCALRARGKSSSNNIKEAMKRIIHFFLVDGTVNNLSATMPPWKLKGFKRGIALLSTVI